MDISLTRHNVRTEELLFSAPMEIQIEDTVHISNGREPRKILKCSGKIAVSSKYVSDKTVTIEGTANISIIYLDEQNCLCNFEHSSFFSKTLEGNVDLTGADVSVKVTDEKFYAKLLSDCSVSINIEAGLEVSVTRTYDKEMLCDIDIKNIEKLRGVAESTMPMAYGEKNLVIEEEISIGASQPSALCLIRSNAVAHIEDTKIMGGKVMVKGMIKIYVLYQTVEGTRPQSFEESFPFSQLIDTQGIGDNCKCDSFVKILFCELSPRTTGDDEIRSFIASIKLAVSVKAYCEDEIPTIIDAYSTCGGYAFKKDKLAFKKIRESFCEKFIAKKSLEFTDGAIGSVIDMWCETKCSSSKFEDKKLKIMGTILVNLLAYDCDGNPECYERPIDFEYSYMPQMEYKDPNVVYNITVANCSYTITGANTVVVAAEPQVSVTIYDNLKYDVIVDVVKDENNCIVEPRGSSIVLYFAETGERVWDIARKYNSSVEEIKVLNAVKEDVLCEPKKFIIPTK
ncbi:MAG: DUF3794 domain-containing protein [Clostridia bacterium]|nr:DUF3794 domain-containing protein [Clostridia bacterium]